MESNSKEFMTDSCVGDQQPQEPRSSSDIFAPNVALQLQLSLHSTGVSASASSASASNMPRIRWTQELHEAFADAVNQLGGCKSATPEGVLGLMNVEGLTIYHVRRHLQKYRVARVRPESSEDNSDDSMTDVEQMSPVDLTMNMTTTKALRMQIKLQKQLHEQLEIQRKLQLHIEEQGKHLLQMLESQNKAEKDKLLCKEDSDVNDIVGMDTSASSQALAETSRGSNGKRQVLDTTNGADQCPEADESAPPPLKCPRPDNSLSK